MFATNNTEAGADDNGGSPMPTYGATVTELPMNKKKNIALVAHYNRKRDLIEWFEWNYKVLLGHNLICMGTTGRKIDKTLKDISERVLFSEPWFVFLDI